MVCPAVDTLLGIIQLLGFPLIVEWRLLFVAWLRGFLLRFIFLVFLLNRLLLLCIFICVCFLLACFRSQLLVRFALGLRAGC